MNDSTPQPYNDDRDRDSDEPRREPSSDGRKLYVVGIGASAGGLEPLEDFFSAIPEATGIAFIVLQHLSPDYESRMAELLRRKTKLPVRNAEHGLPLEPDHVYLGLPRQHMIVANGKLALAERSPDEGFTLPIDVLFRSLANEYGNRAIGVVLSGTGSDGTRGAQAIREAGGFVVSQTPESAKFDGMPRSVLQAGVVHAELEPAAAAAAVASYANHGAEPSPYEPEGPTEDPTPMMRVMRALRDEFGLDFSSYKQTTVGRRLTRRLQIADCRNMSAYALLVEQDREELSALYHDLLIGVTQFFRDEAAFQALDENVLRPMLDNADGEVRVWVAGCATGEEAYSVAILLMEHAARIKKHVKLRIFGTDVHARSLVVANAGVYPKSKIEGMSPERRERYFVEEGPEHVRVSKALRRTVVFARHNLLSDAPFTRIDLVCCRNMLIYLQPPAQGRVLSLLHFALKSRGVLFLGESETPGPLADEFETLDGCVRTYRKRRDVRLQHEARVIGGPIPALSRHERSQARWTGPASPDRRMIQLYDRLLDEFMPPSVLVDERYQVIHTLGGAEAYLQVGAGRISINILDLVDSNLRSTLLSALQQAESRGRRVRYTDVLVQRGPNDHVLIDLTVRPYPSAQVGDAFHIVMEPAEREQPDIPVVDLESVSVSEDHVRSLQEELRFAKENLQATVEELETSNEELQATNEELVASNEELQSTNEELHSVNEELYTVNSEHQRQIVELTELTNDIDNLLQSLEVGVVFLDADLKVRKFTRSASSVLPIQPEDVGRSIAHFASNLEGVSLVQHARDVMASGTTVEREVLTTDGGVYLLRVLPYRGNSGVEGAVITLIDIDGLKQRDAEILRLSSMVSSLGDAVVSVDLKGAIVDWNPGATEMLDYDAPSAKGNDVRILVPTEHLAEFDARVNKASKGERLEPIETVRRRRDGGRVHVSEAVAPIRDERKSLTGYGLIMRDIRRLKLAEAQVRRAVKQRDQFIAVLSHELRNPLMGIQASVALLEDQVSGPTSERALAVCRRQIRQMSRILEDLLDVSRIRREEIDMELSTVDLRTIVDPVVASVSRRVEDAGVELKIDVPERPVWVRIDEDRMQQVVVNLLANSIKFTEPGRRVRLVVDRDESHVLIVVSDEGVGISDDNIATIFDPFVQGDPSAPELPGMGLGLAVSRAIARAHGGDIVASSPGRGRGSTFVVRLPPAEAPLDMGGTQPTSPAAKTPSYRILVVEDQEDNRELLTLLLSREGHRVRAAGTGRDALTCLESEDVDVCILDLGLPDMSGLDVARRIRELDRANELFLVALTGHGTQRDRDETEAAGFDLHLTKPVDMNVLRTTLSKLEYRLDAKKADKGAGSSDEEAEA